MNVRLLPAAAEDIASAAVWYESQRSQLGQDFKDEVMTTLRRIGETPGRYRVVFETYRRAMVRRFPYTVYFRVTGETVLIYAVYHHSRDPQALAERSN